MDWGPAGWKSPTVGMGPLCRSMGRGGRGQADVFYNNSRHPLPECSFAAVRSPHWVHQAKRTSLGTHPRNAACSSSTAPTAFGIRRFRLHVTNPLNSVMQEHSSACALHHVVGGHPLFYAGAGTPAAGPQALVQPGCRTFQDQPCQKSVRTDPPAPPMAHHWIH